VPDLVRVLPAKVRLQRAYWLVTHADTHDLARVKLMTEFIRAEAAGVPAGFWLD
jgi:DNA-binding transcriptional LysR family regulator